MTGPSRQDKHMLEEKNNVQKYKGAHNIEQEEYRSKRVHTTQLSLQDKLMLEDKELEDYRSTRVPFDRARLYINTPAGVQIV